MRRQRRGSRPRRGVGANNNNGMKVPLWAAMVAMVGAAFYFGARKR